MVPRPNNRQADGQTILFAREARHVERGGVQDCPDGAEALVAGWQLA